MTAEAARAGVVSLTLQVDVPIEKAFEVFTKRMAKWWPASHHIGGAPFFEIVVEPRAGGRWFERDEQGVECDWGRVLVWEPPRRLVLGWHLQTDFRYSPLVAQASEVVLDFIALGPESTRLDFEHRHLERHGENYLELVKSVGSPGGWPMILDSFARLARDSSGGEAQ